VNMGHLLTYFLRGWPLPLSLWLDLSHSRPPVEFGDELPHFQEAWFGDHGGFSKCLGVMFPGWGYTFFLGSLRFHGSKTNQIIWI